MHFDLNDLRLFVCVAEESNMRRGAERAFLSMAAASIRIKQLEESIGTALLYRKASGVQVTPAGAALLQHARMVLERVEQLKYEMREYSAGAKGRVTILANTTAFATALPVALSGFLAERPEVSIDLRHRLSTEIVKALNDSQADLGIVAGAELNTEGLEVRHFATDDLVLVVPPGHRLEGERGTTFQRSLEEPHISLPQSSALPAFLMTIARSMGCELEYRIRVASFEAICLMVEANVGVAVLPKSSALRHARSMDVRIVPLEDAWARRQLKIVSRPLASLPPLAAEVIRHLELHGPTALARVHQRMIVPPLTSSTVPVMYSASAEAK